MLKEQQSKTVRKSGLLTDLNISAIAMSSQVHDARYLLALLMDILLCNVLMLSTSVASSGIIGGMQKSSYFDYMGID